MNSSALLTLFRSEVRDAAAPYLWSDAEVYAYIDDAQKMFCRLQGGIADATSAVTRLTPVVSAPYVDLSPLILKIRQARMTADGRDIPLLNFEDLQHNRTRIDSTEGVIRAMVLGMEANKARLVDIPEAVGTIDLIVYRLPLTAITGASQSLEIDEHHHRHLLLWVKHLAHMKQDAETYDRGRSDMYKAEFEGYCANAKAERERREHKYRTVAYGGY